MFPLHGAIQSYAWGKIGNLSLVARLKKSASEGFDVKADQPYAELWMGTHVSGPALIHCSKLGDYNEKPLYSWLKDHPEALGKSLSSSAELPFLLKVLSVQKALSIQAHPNKRHAEELHKSYPDLYKDPNHKPEMAIALTQFQALCGFRPIQEIQQVLKDVPELGEVIGHQNVEEFCSTVWSNEIEKKQKLRKIFENLMTSNPDLYEQQIINIKKRLELKKEPRSSHEELFLRITEEFPGDIGCLGLFLFNYLTLEPGQAIYLAANEPHAYLKGDCVECMACSDNVVRAGLTPKFKDVNTLCSMLTYDTKSSEDNIFKGQEEAPNIILFKSPVPDFSLSHIKIPSEVASQPIPKRDNASIILVVEGEGTISSDKDSFEFGSGSIFFISGGLEVKVQSLIPASIFQAFSLI